MIRQSDPKNARLISVIAATLISLACGTNYVYSAWGPQFAQRLKLNSTQSNLIGTAGNLGMYVTGIPFGMMVDAKGPHWGVGLGAIFLGIGYFFIARAYDAGPQSFGVATLCCLSFLTGAGSCSSFTGALKTAALNYPESRGTATAFPLAAFGLSAFFFSTVASFAMNGNTSGFLFLLASGTFILPVASFFFLRVIPPSPYGNLPQQEQQALRRTSHAEHRATGHEEEPTAPSTPRRSKGQAEIDDPSDEEASLLSSPCALDTRDLESSKHSLSGMAHANSHLDVKGFALLPYPEFWQLFSMLGILTGIGLMTINNIGNDVQALWYHYAPSTPSAVITTSQGLHVSILSFCSFTGRLLSGVGSDFLVKKLDRSRFWCVFVSAVTFCIAQLVAANVSNPHLIGLVSGLTGLAYGMLFGVYPSLVAHVFGINGMSQNWGTMTLAPVISGNIFNLLYGHIFDSHSVVSDDGDLQCHEGLACYRSAYLITFFAAIGGICFCAWSIWHENRVHNGRLTASLAKFGGRLSGHDRAS